MANLFQTSKQNISLHLQNIFSDTELEPGATIKESLTVQREGGRSVQRCVEFYNLDAIISVGHRVKSAIATRFRIWAAPAQVEAKGRREVKPAEDCENLNAVRCRRANGASTHQPRATPWELGHKTIHQP
jgi:hypothetical protein